MTLGYPTSGIVFMSKSQGHWVTKCKTEGNVWVCTSIE